MKKLFALLVFTLLLTACTEPVQTYESPEDDSDVTVESQEGITENDSEVTAEPQDEPKEEPQYEEIKFSEEYISPYQVLTEEQAMEITGGKLYNYAPLDKSENEKAYITPTGKLVYIKDYRYEEMCRTESGIPSVFDYETVGPTDFEVNFIDKSREAIYPDEKFGYEPVELKICDYRENPKYVKVVVSDFEAKNIWYELYADSYQVPIEGTSKYTNIIGCYGIATSGVVRFTLGLQAQSDDFIVGNAIFNDEDWVFKNTAWTTDDSMYAQITDVSRSMASTSHAVGEYRFLARVWDDKYELVHYELISIKITREYNAVVLTVTNYEDEIDPWYLGEDDDIFDITDSSDIENEPAPEIPEEPVVAVPVEPVVPEEPVVEVPVGEPVIELPVEVPVSEYEFPTVSRFEPGAALTEVETDVDEAFLYMSPEEAQKLTNGAIIPYPEENIDGRNAYLTPSGKLVYMDEWSFGKLPEGTVDFSVNWSSPDNSYSPVSVSGSKSAVAGSVVEFVYDYEVKDVKYDLYVDYLPATDSFDPVDTFGCYGVAVEGQIDFSFGFKVDSEKYEGYTVRLCYCNDGDPFYLNGKVGETIIIGTHSRKLGVKTSGYTEGIHHPVTVEILDGRGSVVYKENMMLFENKEFPNNITFNVRGD